MCSLMGLMVVVMVAGGGASDGLSGGGDKRGKVGWVTIRVEEGGVGTQGGVRVAKS